MRLSLSASPGSVCPPGFVKDRILVKVDNADIRYEYVAEWSECLDWKVTPLLLDEQADH